MVLLFPAFKFKIYRTKSTSCSEHYFEAIILLFFRTKVSNFLLRCFGSVFHQNVDHHVSYSTLDCQCFYLFSAKWTLLIWTECWIQVLITVERKKHILWNFISSLFDEQRARILLCTWADIENTSSCQARNGRCTYKVVANSCFSYVLLYFKLIFSTNQSTIFHGQVRWNRISYIKEVCIIVRRFVCRDTSLSRSGTI